MFRSEQQPQGQPGLTHIPTQSWYPSSVLTPPSLSRVSSASNNSTHLGSTPLSQPGKSQLDESGVSLQSLSRASPTGSFATAFPPLRDKSVEELRKLLTDKVVYNEFLLSLDQVRTLDILREDLRKSNMELAKRNLEGESKIAELRNQCAIIRTMELAAAQERFDQVQKEERNLVDGLSAPVLIEKLQEVADQVDEESERLHQQLLAGEIELMEYISKYRKLRVLYHQRILTRLAATGLPG